MSADEPLDIQIDFAKHILDHSQNLISLVDTKAGVLLAADGAILALLTSSSLTGTSVATHTAFVVAAILLAASAAFGFGTIYPRTIQDSPPTRIFFLSILEKERDCLLYTSPSPRDLSTSRMPSSA